MVTDSELSDQFSIDTVGSHGAVKCKGLKMDYQVSSFCAYQETVYFKCFINYLIKFYEDVMIHNSF